MTDERKAIVAAGYHALGEAYLDWASGSEDPRERMLEKFSTRLPSNARVLNLGCGAGIPSTKILAERFVVTGVDISEEQVRAARRPVSGRVDHQCQPIGDRVRGLLLRRCYRVLLDLSRPAPRARRPISPSPPVACPKLSVPGYPRRIGQPGLDRRLVRPPGVLQRLRRRLQQETRERGWLYLDRAASV